MKASEFNAKYKNLYVKLLYLDNEYVTSGNTLQAWTNSKYETCIVVFGLVSSIPLKDCKIISSFK